MEYKQFINGGFVTGSSGNFFSVVSPSTEKVLGEYELASDVDIYMAIESAANAFESWKKLSALVRAEYLWKIAQNIRDGCEAMATQIAHELGKPLNEAKKEVATAAEMFEWSAEEARRLYGRTIPARSEGIQQIVELEPRGAVGAMSGWNAPAITPSRKISAALAAGCSIVIKPSEETAGVALLIAQAAQKAGLPQGVLNIVFGDPAQIANIFCSSPLLSMITFTGGTEVGKQLATQAARHMKHATLELGGHAPVIVWNDVNIPKVAEATAKVKFRNSGQVCTSPTRFLIHADIYDEFCKEFVKQSRLIVVGDPFQPDTEMGPLKNARRLRAIENMVSASCAQGAQLLLGGKRLDQVGYYYEPTVLAVEHAEIDACRIEPFGPIAVMMKIDDIDTAIAEANALPFGLASYAFTQNMKIAYRLSKEINSGVVCINELQASLPETPFGGFKDSGLGSEGGIEGLREFVKTKCVRQGWLL